MQQLIRLHDVQVQPLASDVPSATSVVTYNYSTRTTLHHNGSAGC